MTKPEGGTWRPLSLDGAAEVVRCQDTRRGWLASDVSVTHEGGFWAAPSEYHERKRAWRRAHADERVDPKLALRSVRRDPQGGLSLTVQATDWAETRPLHWGPPLNAAEAVRPTADGCEFLLPNIAVVHVVAVTRDHWVLCFQRSASSHYHPGAWSASYEEGVAPDDGVAGDFLQRAARRGLAEEITPAAREYALDHFHVLAVVLETPILNPAVVVLAHLPLVLAELPTHAPSDELSVADHWAIRGDVGAVRAALKYAPPHHGSWHPTARYRLLLAAAHMFGDSVVMQT